MKFGKVSFEVWMIKKKKKKRMNDVRTGVCHESDTQEICLKNDGLSPVVERAVLNAWSLSQGSVRCVAKDRRRVSPGERIVRVR